MMSDERDPNLEVDDIEEYDDAGDEIEDIPEAEIDEYLDDAAANGDDPADQLRELVVWLVSQLMDEPENVSVEAVERGSSVQIQVRLPEEDLGKIIGRGGRIAKSIRTALTIAGSRHNVRVSLDIEGND